MKEVVIFGAGGHGKVVLDILNNYEDVKVCAFSSLVAADNLISGIPIISFEDALRKFHCGIVAIGENFTRQKVVNDILNLNPKFQFINAIHPSAIIAKNSKLGLGCSLCAGTIVNVNSSIGDHVIVNTGSIVEHDCTVGDFAQLAPNVAIGGDGTVKKGAYLGLGCSVIHTITIGEFAICGAHSLINCSIPDYEMYYGVPAKFIKKLSHGYKLL